LIFSEIKKKLSYGLLYYKLDIFAAEYDKNEKI